MQVCGTIHGKSEADICSAPAHVRFTPKSGHVQRNEGCPLCAKSGHWSPRDNEIGGQSNEEARNFRAVEPNRAGMLTKINAFSDAPRM
jgi:hypothetical protein